MNVINKFPKKEYLMNLINEAVGRSFQIGAPYDNDLASDFKKAQETLQNLTGQKSQQALILSATRVLITQGEKKTIALIVGDDPITGQQMSHLVRIRLICAELTNILVNMLEWIRGSLKQSGLSSANISDPW